MTSLTTQDVRAEAGKTPARGLRIALLRRLCARLRCGALSVITPDGRRFDHRTGVAGPEATLAIHKWRVLRRLLVGGDVAFGEAYIDGDWSSPDPVALIELAARNDTTLAPVTDGSLPAWLINRLLHRLRANTLTGSRRNIVEHYDLGNAFYEQWLDPGMSYSSALYRDPAMTLEAAQTAKQDRIIELLDVRPGHKVLEIGCGWGGMAMRLARAGCRVTALTLSPSQRDYALAALQKAGLADRVEVRLEDYREVAGNFDRIVSVEMIEAVGEAYWPAYFACLRDRLVAGGIAVLQAITIEHARLATYRQRPDFIQRHVFPGGMLPSPEVMSAQIDGVGLRLDDCERFGASYARTLSEWRARFAGAWPAIATQGFSTRFQRFWDYYLAYCEAGFRAGSIDVGLWRIVQPV